TSPVKHFMRTATCDSELGGKTIKKGQDVRLAYWSANRDEAGFDDPVTCDVGRKTNRHVAFGFGTHFCLGSNLAKMELTNLFTTLVPRLRSVEPAGEAELSRSTFVSGYKHLPIRYELR
ncbi:MAG: cytochrome P450, partial [Acidimicrobiales bacterium]